MNPNDYDAEDEDEQEQPAEAASTSAADYSPPKPAPLANPVIRGFDTPGAAAAATTPAAPAVPAAAPALTLQAPAVPAAPAAPRPATPTPPPVTTSTFQPAASNAPSGRPPVTEEMARENQRLVDEMYADQKAKLQAHKAAGGQTETYFNGYEVIKQDPDGNPLYHPAVVQPFTRLDDGEAYRVSRDTYGNLHHFKLTDGQEGADYHVDPATGDKYVDTTGADGGSRREVIGQDALVPRIVTARQQGQQHHQTIEQTGLTISQAENGTQGGGQLQAASLSDLRGEATSITKDLKPLQKKLADINSYAPDGADGVDPADLTEKKQLQDQIAFKQARLGVVQGEVDARDSIIGDARQRRDALTAQHIDTNTSLQVLQQVRGTGGLDAYRSDLTTLAQGGTLRPDEAGKQRVALLTNLGLLRQEPTDDGTGTEMRLTPAGVAALEPHLQQAIAADPGRHTVTDEDAQIDPRLARAGQSLAALFNPAGNNVDDTTPSKKVSAPGASGVAATLPDVPLPPTVAARADGKLKAPVAAKAYSIGEDGSLSLDPLHMADALIAANKDGIVPDDRLKELLPQAVKAENAARAQAELQKRVSGDDWAKAKAFATGAGRGTAFFASAIPGAKAGALIGAAIPGLGETGLGEFFGGAIGGLITGYTGTKLAAAAGNELAKHSATIRSFADASQALPQYDNAGNLVSMIVPGAAGLVNLARVGMIRAAEMGAPAALKLTAKEAGVQALGGAAFEGAIRPAFDWALQQGKQALGVGGDSDDPANQMQAPTLGSVAENMILAVALGGLGTKFKGYNAEDVAGLFRRYSQAKAEGANPSDIMSQGELEAMDHVAQKLAKIKASGQPLFNDPENLRIKVRQALNADGTTRAIASSVTVPASSGSDNSSPSGLLQQPSKSPPPAPGLSPEVPAQPSSRAAAPVASPAPVAPVVAASSRGASSASPTPTNPPAAGQASPASSPDDSQGNAIAELERLRDDQLALLKNSKALDERDRPAVQAMADHFTRRIEALRSQQSPEPAPESTPRAPASDTPATSGGSEALPTAPAQPAADTASDEGEASLSARPEGSTSLSHQKAVGEHIDDKRTAFAPDSGTLGILREQMPQVAAEHRGALANFLKARGMDVQEADVLPGSLKPSQADFEPARVQKARAIREDGTVSERRILVSNDGHVIDGHHQWMDRLQHLPTQTMGALRINAPAREILSQIHEFPSAGMEKPADLDAPQTKETPREASIRQAAQAEHDRLTTKKAGGQTLTSDERAKLIAAKTVLARRPGGGVPTTPEGKQAERGVYVLSERQKAQGGKLALHDEKALARERATLARDLDGQAPAVPPAQPVPVRQAQAAAALPPETMRAVHQALDDGQSIPADVAEEHGIVLPPEYVREGDYHLPSDQPLPVSDRAQGAIEAVKKLRVMQREGQPLSPGQLATARHAREAIDEERRKDVAAASRPTARQQASAGQQLADYHAELEEQAHERIKEAGGVELLDALRQAGGLPTDDPVFRGELARVRESSEAAHLANRKGTFNLFRHSAPTLDDLAGRLREQGFDFDTPGDLLDAVENRVASQKPQYGFPAHAEAGSGLEQEAAYYRRQPLAPRTPEELEGQAVKWRGFLQKVAPDTALRLEAIRRDQLDDLWKTAGRVPDDVHAAYMNRTVYLVAEALTSNPERTNVVNLLHEVAHAYEKTLPDTVRQSLRMEWKREMHTGKSLLHDEDGTLRPQVDQRVKDDFSEWFAERLAWENAEWAEGRASAQPRNLVQRIAQGLRTMLIRLYRTLRRAFSAEGTSLKEGQMASDFRRWLSRGTPGLGEPANGAGRQVRDWLQENGSQAVVRHDENLGPLRSGLPGGKKGMHPLLRPTHEIDTPLRAKQRQQWMRNALHNARPVPEGQKPILWLMGGGSGSGKSTVLDQLFKSGEIPREGTARLDSDEIKKSIPEYGTLLHHDDAAASTVAHRESADILKDAFNRALAMRTNAVLDGTLSYAPHVQELIDAARSHGYEVRMEGVAIHPDEAIRRAQSRAAQTGRNVPMGDILSRHRGFLQNVEDYAPQVDRWRLWDNSVPGHDAVPVAKTDAGSFSVLDPGKYDSFKRSQTYDFQRAIQEAAATRADRNARGAGSRAPGGQADHGRLSGYDPGTSGTREEGPAGGPGAVEDGSRDPRRGRRGEQPSSSDASTDARPDDPEGGSSSASGDEVDRPQFAIRQAPYQEPPEVTKALAKHEETEAAKAFLAAKYGTSPDSFVGASSNKLIRKAEALGFKHTPADPNTTAAKQFLATKFGVTPEKLAANFSHLPPSEFLPLAVMHGFKPPGSGPVDLAALAKTAGTGWKVAKSGALWALHDQAGKQVGVGFTAESAKKHVLDLAGWTVIEHGGQWYAQDRLGTSLPGEDSKVAALNAGVTKALGEKAISQYLKTAAKKPASPASQPLAPDERTRMGRRVPPGMSRPPRIEDEPDQSRLDEAKRQAAAVPLQRGADGYPVAPDGRRSQLNDEQWKQVRTPLFKTFFGDWQNDPTSASKILDDHGEPRIMYRGTGGGKEPAMTPNERRQIYLSTEPTFADGYGRYQWEVYANARKPWDYRNPEHIEALRKSLEADPDFRYSPALTNKDGTSAKYKEMLANAQATTSHAQSVSDAVYLAEQGDWMAIDRYPIWEHMQRLMANEGFDGVWITEDGTRNLIVPEATQVKSTTHNVGTFDPSVGDVRFARRGSPDTMGGERDREENPAALTARAPVKAEEAETMAREQVRRHSEMFRGLGLKEARYTTTTNNVSGVQMGSDGVLRVDPAKLARSLTNARDRQAYLGIDSSPEDYFKQALAHEAIHAADIAVARANGQTIKERYDALPKQALPAGWEAAGKHAYGPEWDGLEDWQRKAEFVRQVIEGKWTGRITEQLHRYIQATLNYLKKVAGFQTADPRFKSHVQEVEARINAARDGGAGEASGGGADAHSPGTVTPEAIKAMPFHEAAPALQSAAKQRLAELQRAGEKPHAALGLVANGDLSKITSPAGQAYYLGAAAKAHEAHGLDLGGDSDAPQPSIPTATPTPMVKLPGYLASKLPYTQDGTRHLLDFASDLDKAAFVLSCTAKPAERSDNLLDTARQQTGWSTEQLLAHGRQVQAAIKASIQRGETKGGNLKVPEQSVAAADADAPASGQPFQMARRGEPAAAKTDVPFDPDEEAKATSGEAAPEKGGFFDGLRDKWDSRQEHNTKAADLRAGNYSADTRAGESGLQAHSAIELDFHRGQDKEAQRQAELDRRAAGLIVEAGGRRAQLAADKAKALAGPDKKLSAEYAPIFTRALADFDRLQKSAEGWRKMQVAEDAAAEAAGLPPSSLKRMRAVHDDPSVAASPASADHGFGVVPGHRTAADALAAGKDPKSTDLADLARHYVERNRRAINQAQFLRTASSIKGRDGKPMLAQIEDTDSQLNPDGSVTPTAKVPKGYEAVQAGPNTLAVHKEFAQLFKAMYGDSAVRANPVTNALLKTAGFAKKNTLIFETYHLCRLSATAGLGFGMIDYRDGAAAAKYRLEDLDRAVKAGALTEDQAKSVRESYAVDDELMRAGLTVGKYADAMTEQAHGLLDHVPGIGPAAAGFNRWMFGEVQRGYIRQAGRQVLEHYEKNFPELSRAEMKRRTVKEVGNIFGDPAHTSIFSSKTAQDAANIFAFAARWTEGKLKAELHGFVQAAKIPVDLARGRGIRAGATARAMGALLLGSVIGTQLLNLLTRHQLTWQNEEEDHHWDAFIPGGRHGFWFSPLSISAEFVHGLHKYMSHGENALDAVTHIAENKLSAPARGAKDLVTGEDWRGQHFGSLGERIKAAVLDTLPSPLPLSGMLEKDPKAMLGYKVNHQPGSLEKQGLAAIGLKVDNGESARARMYRVAEPFRAQQQPGSQPHAPSAYATLRGLLEDNNLDGARAELKRLVSGGRKLEKIKQAFNIQSDGTVKRALFTGNAKTEQKMDVSLTPAQRKLYWQAQQEHSEIGQRLKRMLAGGASAPAG